MERPDNYTDWNAGGKKCIDYLNKEMRTMERPKKRKLSKDMNRDYLQYDKGYNHCYDNFTAYLKEKKEDIWITDETCRSEIRKVLPETLVDGSEDNIPPLEEVVRLMVEEYQGVKEKKVGLPSVGEIFYIIQKEHCEYLYKIQNGKEALPLIKRIAQAIADRIEGV